MVIGLLGIESFNHILDHPLFYMSTLKQAPKLGTVLCVDRNHVDYIKRYYKDINQALFLPLAGDNTVEYPQNKWEDRPIDVLFVGTRKTDLGAVSFSEDDWDALIKLLKNTKLTTESVLEEKIRKELPEIDEKGMREKIWENRKIDVCLVTYIRERVVQVLIDAGINVTVYGNWEEWECADSPYFTCGGGLSQEEVLQKMTESKIVLNVMPWFKDGIHDRVINAMLTGAICVTDKSGYMSEVFEKDKDYIGYSLEHLEELPKIVKNILNNENEAMRKCAYETATSHRWIQRIEELERCLDS